MKTWDDCASKCEKCKSFCDVVTDVVVPANGYCAAHYGNCQSKCASFSCNSGYVKSGNSCVPCAEDKCVNSRVSGISKSCFQQPAQGGYETWCSYNASCTLSFMKRSSVTIPIGASMPESSYKSDTMSNICKSACTDACGYTDYR